MAIRSEDVSHHVRLITIDRPERKNAFDQETYLGLAAALNDADSDDNVHVAVVTGGGTTFSAGQDLQEMAALAKGELTGATGFTVLLAVLEGMKKPLIAAVNGAAVGIGATMLLHCDLVYVSSSAGLRFPFAEMGVPPEAGASALLAEQVGRQVAAELLFTARWVGAADAVRHHRGDGRREYRQRRCSAAKSSGDRCWRVGDRAADRAVFPAVCCGDA